jgi:hypothetical protein
MVDNIPSNIKKKSVSFKITKKSISSKITKKMLSSKTTTKKNHILFKNVIKRRYNLSSKVAIKQQPIYIICYKKSQKK